MKQQLQSLTAKMILVSAVALTAFQLQAQKTITLDTPESNDGTNTPIEHEARDWVEMIPGYDYNASGNTTNPSTEWMDAYIDETMVLPADYLSGPADPNRSLNTSLSVGTTPGVVDVSPTGAATYSIPIFTPPGTAGMEPSVSINYNSQAGNGLLGWGWNIGGLSAITRAPQTVYHDGNVNGVDLEDDDRFAMDGNRLIKISGGAYGGDDEEYRTEVETFSRIFSRNIQGTGLPILRLKRKPVYSWSLVKQRMPELKPVALLTALY